MHAPTSCQSEYGLCRVKRCNAPVVLIQSCATTTSNCFEFASGEGVGGVACLGGLVSMGGVKLRRLLFAAMPDFKRVTSGAGATLLAIFQASPGALLPQGGLLTRR